MLNKAIPGLPRCFAKEIRYYWDYLLQAKSMEDDDAFCQHIRRMFSPWRARCRSGEVDMMMMF